MKPSSAYARRVMRSALRREGVRIILRRVTRTGGPDQVANPPRVAGVVVSGNHPIGSPSLSLAGIALVGRLLPGDGIAIANGPVVYVAEAVNAEENGVTVVLRAPLTMAVTGGAAVQFFWAADRVVSAKVTPFPRNLVDGAMILPTDVRVRVSPLDLAAEPSPQDLVVLEMEQGAGERVLTIVNHTPLNDDNVTIAYDIQARAT